MFFLFLLPFRGYIERYYPIWSLKVSLDDKSNLSTVDFFKTDWKNLLKTLAVAFLGYLLLVLALFGDDFAKIVFTVQTALVSAPLIVLFWFSYRIARSFFVHLSKSKDLRHARLYMLLDAIWIQSYQLLLVALILAPAVSDQSANENAIMTSLIRSSTVISVLVSALFAVFVAGSFVFIDKLKSNPRDIFYLLFVNNINPAYPILSLIGSLVFGYVIVLVTLNTRIVNWQILFFFPLLYNLPIFLYLLLMSCIVIVRPESIHKFVYDSTKAVFKADFEKSLLFYSATSLGLLAFGILSIF